MADTFTRELNKLPLERDFRIPQGDGIEWLLSVTANGTALDMSAWTVTLDVDAEDETSIVDGRAVTIGGGSNNQLKLLITGTDTAALDGQYTYAIKGVAPDTDPVLTDGLAKTLFKGKIEVIT